MILDYQILLPCDTKIRFWPSLAKLGYLVGSAEQADGSLIDTELLSKLHLRTRLDERRTSLFLGTTGDEDCCGLEVMIACRTDPEIKRNPSSQVNAVDKIRYDGPS
jgi:hypothetical protein